MNQILDPITRSPVSLVCERCEAKLQSPKDDNMYDEDYHGILERVCSKCFNRACMVEEQLQKDIASDRRYYEEMGYGYIE